MFKFVKSVCIDLGKFNHNVRSKHYVKSKSDDLQFTIHHYAGKVQYNARNFLQKNRNFLPPEVIHLLRQSRLEVIRYLFQCPLARTGNLFALGQQNGLNGLSAKYSPGGSSGRVDDFHMIAFDVSIKIIDAHLKLLMIYILNVWNYSAAAKLWKRRRQQQHGSTSVADKGPADSSNLL